MDIKTIPLSRLETELRPTLEKCVDSGQTAIVELPDRRLVVIQSFDPMEDVDLGHELLETNTAFQALVAKSRASPRPPFPSSPETENLGRREGEMITKHVLTVFHCFIAVLLTSLGLFLANQIREKQPLSAIIVALGMIVLPVVIATRIGWRTGYEAGKRAQDQP